jgi:glyceraldehyde 3-phosphate dehydrogenase
MNILLNGIGRIGKSILRIAQEDKSLNIIAINELNTNIENIAYAINYDSTYGKLQDKFKVQDACIENSYSTIQILNFKSLQDIDYTNLGIDIIIDASGAKIEMDMLNSLDVKHIFLTHPNKNASINLILGVNDNIDLTNHKIISTSSCNSTALLPVLKIIDDRYGIACGDITTIHPLLNHQKVLDSSCIGSTNRNIDCSFEFGRSSVQNIIPSATTTVDACSYVLNHIDKNLLSSSSFRVSNATVGAINISLLVENSCCKDELIEIFQRCEKTQIHKVILNNFEPLVSGDFIKEKYTTIIDHRFTDIKKQKFIKLVLWYDNEYGYASKVIDIVNTLRSTTKNKI